MERDARHGQIAILGGLLVYGMSALAFFPNPIVVALTLCTALCTQFVATSVWSVPRFEPRSALITALSLCLLLRASELWVLPLAAFCAILSKFVLRVGGKHIFNPACFGILVALLTTSSAWVSSGQWGQTAVFAFVLAALGLLIVHQVGRYDVSLAFLATWLGARIAKALWFGDPLAIPFHDLQNGALVLFAFFMVSDPRTTPERGVARLLFGGMVALIAVAIESWFYRTDSLFFALAGVALLLPLFDVGVKRRFSWKTPRRLFPQRSS